MIDHEILGGSTNLVARFAAVRARTDRLTSVLHAEDQVVQSMPDASPTKWHRAHTTSFFETFVLKPFQRGYVEFDPAYAFLFNSYYEAAGPRHARAERGKITRPGVAQVGEYRRHVDRAMAHFLTERLDHDVVELVVLGLHHEQQHQELLLMDIKHLFSLNPLAPSYFVEGEPREISEPGPLGWHRFDGGIVPIGYKGSNFCFDNEQPRHDVLLSPYRLADRLVTCGEWLEFMADGGYRRPDHWLSDGWHTVKQNDWTAPGYWRQIDGEWHVFTLAGMQPINPAAPVCHLSYYEADAYAAWAQRRLPTEAEWEHAAESVTPDVDESAEPQPYPRPAGPTDGTLRQLYDELWQWTSSPYSPYPGFSPAPGAVGEYNGKFMVNTWVLRGGCVATPPGHIRSSYRNFFYPGTRWHFSGLRLASEA